MEHIRYVIDLFLHLDKHLSAIITQYGAWTYAILFAIVFLETGLVVTPFLPGDSLLFAAGTFAALHSLNLWMILGLLTVAAVLGDTVNYAIGAYLGPKVFHFEKSRFFNPEHLKRTHEFYEKYGGKTIIIARFVPIIRTFAPFVAGVGSMSYATVPELQRHRWRGVGLPLRPGWLLLRRAALRAEELQRRHPRDHRDLGAAGVVRVPEAPRREASSQDNDRLSRTYRT